MVRVAASCGSSGSLCHAEIVHRLQAAVKGFVDVTTFFLLAARPANGAFEPQFAPRFGALNRLRHDGRPRAAVNSCKVPDGVQRQIGDKSAKLC